MIKATDVDMPTTTGWIASGNINSAQGSTTLLRTETPAPTINKKEGRNKNDRKSSNNAKNTTNTVPLVTESFEEMTPAIKTVLSLPGEKVASAKIIDGFCKDFLTNIVENMENGADIVPFFRDDEDPIEILEKERIPVLKMLDPIDPAATTK